MAVKPLCIMVGACHTFVKTHRNRAFVIMISLYRFTDCNKCTPLVWDVDLQEVVRVWDQVCEN